MKEIIECIESLKSDEMGDLCKKKLNEGISPQKIIDAMHRGMDKVGEKYESGEYFLPELLVAGETMKKGFGIIEPYLSRQDKEFKGVMVLGTVEGDLHDIGKNIFASFAKGAGFKIIDLGSDVPAEKFVKAVKEKAPSVVGMSCLITTMMHKMEEVMEALRKNDLRKRVKVIIGGAPITEEFGKQIGADGAVNDSMEGVKILRRWFE